jgi:hypothetical protein
MTPWEAASMAFPITIDQMSGMLPRAKRSAAPMEARAKDVAHRASALRSGLCSQVTDNKPAATASARTTMIESVERSSVMVESTAEQ